MRLTARAGHAGELAHEALAEGCGLVVAVGGDGTINEVAAALIGTGAVLGVVPGGSGNGLGRALGLGLSAGRALQTLKHGRTRCIDTGIADGHPFFNLAGLGFEAEIAARFNRSSRRGLAGYFRVAAASLDLLRASRFAVTTETQRRELEALTLTVANGQQFGGHALIAPRARLDDGRLDLTTVPPPTAWNALPLVLALFRGTLAARRHDDNRRSLRGGTPVTGTSARRRRGALRRHPDRFRSSPGQSPRDGPGRLKRFAPSPADRRRAPLRTIPG